MEVGGGVIVTVTARSETDVTPVEVEATLSAGVGSNSFAEAVTVSVIEGAVDPEVVITIVSVTEALLASVPMLPITEPGCCVTVPWVDVAKATATFEGSASTSVTPVALDGPWFVTTIVYVTLS